jgi:ABC-2 type transport system permease protein
MKKYFLVFTNSIQETLQYRVRQLIWAFSELTSLLFIPFIWLSLYTKGSVIGGMTSTDIITYFVLVSLVSMATTTYISKYIAENIHKGSLSTDLTKPYSYIFWRISRELGMRMLYTLLAPMLLFIGKILLPAYIVFPESLEAFIWFLFFLIIARILCIFSEIIVGFLAFWFEQVWGFNSVRWLLDSLAGGRLIPISFFSRGIQGVLYVLPFAFMLGIPVDVYLGKITGIELYEKALLGLSWVGVYSAIIAFMWHRGLKRYNGGGI